MKNFLLVIIILSLASCRGKDTLSVIADAISQGNIQSSKTLVLYLSEGMCSDCINKELINLKENPAIENNIVIVGVFSSKKAMYSTLGDLDLGDREIYVDAKRVKYPQEYTPRYVIYDKNSNSFSNQFLPSPCSPDGTISYFKKIASILY